ncbi:MAG: transporter [Deltaproteobacteria bacterium HGW-Deltaproteobacteria-8]|jgi:osmotically-inducible protein OsmY|nr:MAG: transporter [Deltaproteobacteria bacterium HGW-Deltaproteobacteria-8]
MRPHSRKIIFASGLLLALAASSGVAAAGTVSQEITDARQETQIWTTYALSPYLRANNLSVSVQNNKATLTGTVEEDVSKELATEIALGVGGIKEVDNRIVVQPGYAPPQPSSDRSYGEVVDDAVITTSIKSKLAWSKNTDGLNAKVDTKFGRVQLRGTADSAASKELAGRLAINTRGVASVDNQLAVVSVKQTAAQNAKASVHEAKQELADSWITAKVKSTFLYSSNVSGSDITVNTDKGVVSLSGKLKSGAERALAIELAQNVRGVRSVQAKALRF